MQNNLEKNIDFLKINSDFVPPIIIGILQRVVLLFLVLIPIQALRSVSRGIISRKFKLFFNYLI